MLDVVHAYVVKVNWADLQPQPNGPIAADNAIDKAIARVRQSDYKQVGMALKLRVFAGINAPDWVKKLGGAPIQYTNNQAGRLGRRRNARPVLEHRVAAGLRAAAAEAGREVRHGAGDP